MRAPAHRYTWQDYLALEQTSNVKHEFFDGEIYAMAGGSPAHSALAVAISSSLYAQLEGGGCRVFNSDLRIRVQATGLGTYPDVTVVCGELQYDPDNPRTTVVNPTVIVEVSSESTEAFDRGAKFDHYRQIPSLREYVIASTRERLLEVFRRDEAGEWIRSEARSSAALRLASITCELRVDRVYAGVEL